MIDTHPKRLFFDATVSSRLRYLTYNTSMEIIGFGHYSTYQALWDYGKCTLKKSLPGTPTTRVLSNYRKLMNGCHLFFAATSRTSAVKMDVRSAELHDCKDV
uniref:Protein kinase domain-containing protein n=1 Tax=Steinernema glaseri TaxID=37863 RepID=A0A1I7Y930_9BILA